ncbi:MAG: tyrosine-type recombinase/integrase [Fluviibacter sp.]
MASIVKYKNGWRALVCVKSVRDSQIFELKGDAKIWAAQRETEIRADTKKTPGERYTLDQALEKYSSEVSIKKRGKHWEEVRINAFRSDPESHRLPLVLPIGEVTTGHLAEWRDHRLTKVSTGTVLRELTILINLFEVCRKEWGWVVKNPTEDMSRPSRPEHRDRLISWFEIRKMLRALNWQRGPCRTKTQAVGRAFMLALRSGMRAGEICNLKLEFVFDDHCLLPVTKSKPRRVPLTRQSFRLIESMQGWSDQTVFGVDSRSRDALFRKAREKAGLAEAGFRFHDARHTAATMTAKKIDILDLCKIFGWSDPKMAMVYYNPTVSDLAARLNKN